MSPTPMDTPNTKLMNEAGVEEIILLAKDIHGAWRIVISELVLTETIDDIVGAVKDFAL